jgi:MATE family multidrug resistance protein
MRALLKLALPVIGTYLGFMSMGFVDLIIVGRVSATAVGALGIGTSIFSWFMVCGIGLLSGMDFHVGHSFGRGGIAGRQDCDRVLAQGLWLSVICSLPVTPLLVYLAGHLEWFGVNPAILPETRGYLVALAPSLLPALVFAAFRNYLQAVGGATAMMLILVAANVLNAGLNYVLVFGHLGAPALGAEGAAYATLISRVLMVVAAVPFILRKITPGGEWRRYHAAWMRKVLRLGLPASAQMALEVGVFATATLLAGGLAAEQLAAHQVVLNVASVMFMIPLGLSSAAAVRISQDLGAGHPAAARRSGNLALGLCIGFMLVSCGVLLGFPGAILRLYTSVDGVIAAGTPILLIAAVFQLWDGMQTVLTGVLRGVADTRGPLVANLVGHWLVGLPLGAWLCFRGGRGLAGLWIGLATGLGVVAVSLYFRWRALEPRPAGPAPS